MPRDSEAAPQLSISIGQYSDAGRKSANQDFHGALIPKGAALALKGVVLAVADGVSSSPVSGEASEIAVASLLTDYYCTSDAWTVKTSASRIIAATNAWLHAQNRRARLEDRERGRICTLSALILKGRAAHVFHVGDSRVWRVQGDGLEPLTEDHQVVLSAAEVYLGRSLGAEPQVEIDYRRIDLAEGDVFLLTTDGVHEHMDPRLAVRLIREAEDLDEAARRIAEEALARGADDNLTIQLARVDRLPAASAAEALGETERLVAPPLPQAGDLIDGFRILRRIHASSRSHIYLAAAPDGGQVALKIPSIDMRDDPRHLRRFLMEEWIARRISSAHVLRPAAPAERRSSLYVVTEYVDGQTLRQWMRDHPSPDLEEVRGMVDQIIQGLRAFHRREMLHQDLRPENIMIDRDGVVKIIDFGSTYVAGVQEDDRAPGEDILGTLQYTAPEYFTGDPVSWRSDLFSLGVIAYEMLTGRLPYGANVSKIRTRSQLSRLVYRSARDDRHPTPDWIDEALKRAVHPDPLRRQDALSEFASQLRGLGRERGLGRHRPLLERDPVLFWKLTALLFALISLILLARTA